MTGRVMILGASRYYVRSILAARELGCEVLAIDRNPEAEGFRHADFHEAVDITDIKGAVRTARRYGVDGVVAVNDFGVRTAAAIARELKLVGISPEVAEYATSKAWMRRKWEERGVPSAQFRVIKTLEEARRAVEELNTWPLVLKPADSRGGGSRGVSRIDDENQLERALIFAQSFYEDKAVVIEEFIEGIEHSIETITFEGETHVLAVSDKVKTPPPFRVDKSVIYPTVLTGERLERVHEVAKAAVRALDIDVGAAHIEMCTTESGPRLFELGARCGGGGTPDPIVPFLTGIEMFKEVVRIALGERPQRLSPLYTKGCVYRFITPRPGTIRKISGLEEVKTWENILDCELLVGVGDTVREVEQGGDRAGFIIAGGETRPQAIELADRAESHIRFDYQ
ncbi:MAG: ATP-grasp domain-containing protein [Pyrinomonadaceae bacterium]|nr:ATP-grasp domain-containing protein [Pyrinomonadaceae bacterium]